MPRIELIPQVYYQPNDPYHWEIDNLPLKNIIQRQELINFSLDNVLDQMRDAIGTQGTVANRLNQSIDADGNLKASAIDQAMHSIEAHEDTLNFVRMTRDQSEKLDNVSENATDVKIRIDLDGSSEVLFDSGTVAFRQSTTIIPTVEAPNKVKFHMVFPAEAAHRHFYGLQPVPVNPLETLVTEFKVNNVATPFVEGSLRVYINGVRIFEGESNQVYAPSSILTDPWTLMYYTPDHENGLFTLSSAVTDDDVIMIDFDILLL